jgi:hypothetical protein
MTDTPIQPAPPIAASPEPTAPAVPAPAVAAPVAPPAGFVPQSALEAEQTRARTFQAELDRTKAELAKVTAAPAPPAPVAGTEPGFDPVAFKQELLGQVYGATAIASTSERLKVEFPHADPALFSPEKLAQFGSPEALRIAAEADHNRVAAILAAHVPAAPAPAPAPSPLGPVALPAPGVDPTVQQLAAMSPGQLAAFEATNPGVAERVLMQAQIAAA